MPVDPALLAVLLGLAAALCIGASDFSGGMAAKGAGVFGVVTLAQGTGLLLMLALALALGEPALEIDRLAWGVASGVLGGLGVAALYRALAVGLMGLVAPVTGVLSAALPVAFGAFIEGAPGTLKLMGFGLALVGIWFLSRPEKAASAPRGLRLALLAGLAFGVGIVLLGQAGEVGLFWPLTAVRAGGFSIMLGVFLLRREAWLPGRAVLLFVLLTAVLEAAGSVLFLLSRQLGRLDVAAVLLSLYPAGTVLLAMLVLKERLTRMQAAGMLAALLAVPLIAA